MGRKSTRDGLEVRGSTIRFRFVWNGRRYHEVLPYDPTIPKHMDEARRLARRVKTRIDDRDFTAEDFARYFPKSKKAARAPEPAPVPTFAAYVKTWKGTLLQALSTKRDYIASMQGYWARQFGDRTLTEITHTDILTACVEMQGDELSGRTINNRLTPLRLLFRLAVAEKIVLASPLAEIENVSYQPPPPDPFDRDERDTILKHMYAHYPEQVGAYFQFAFYTGLRPSEQIVLSWPDIDYRKKTALVHRARVRNHEKGTKTNKNRYLNLGDGALDALRRMEAFTKMKGGTTPIFVHPRTGAPWQDTRDQCALYFMPTQRALGMRQRIAYHTRHTYATLALMAGVNVAFISQQLGHAKVTTTLTHYAHWIVGSDGGVEAEKLNMALNGQEWPKNGPTEKQA